MIHIRFAITIDRDSTASSDALEVTGHSAHWDNDNRTGELEATIDGPRVLFERVLHAIDTLRSARALKAATTTRTVVSA